jgi:hypothetical protein
MLAALKLPLFVDQPALPSILRVVLTDVTPPVLLVAFVVVALRESRLVRGAPMHMWSSGPARLGREGSQVNV